MSDKNRLTIQCGEDDLYLFKHERNVFHIELETYNVVSHDKIDIIPIHIERYFPDGLNDFVEASVFKYQMMKTPISKKIRLVTESDNLLFELSVEGISDYKVMLLFVKVNEEKNKKIEKNSLLDSINLIDIPLMALDKKDLVVTVNDAGIALLKRQRHDLIGKSIKCHMFPIDEESYLRGARGELYAYTREDGEKLILKVSETPSTSPYFDRVLLIDDITKEYDYEQRLNYLSRYDKLTATFNRGYFEERVSALRDCKYLPLGIMVVDINGLKVSNDVFGHDVGDELLKVASQILLEVCGNQAVIGRTGGDEFCILIPNTSAASLKKLKKQVDEQSKRKTDLPIPVSMSIGLEEITHAGENLAEKIKLADQKMYNEKLAKSSQFKEDILDFLRKTLDQESHETFQHSKRLHKLAIPVGKELGLSQGELNGLKLLTDFHDIGKIRIPYSVLNKKGMLTVTEWQMVKSHAEAGYRIALVIPNLAPIAKEILHHHEHYDGSGYPDGLTGEEIPLLSRVIAVIDAYDAMTQNRSYQEQRTQMEALDELVACAGTQFDPFIVKVFVKILNRRMWAKKIFNAVDKK